MKGVVGYVDADGTTQEHQHTIMGFAFLINGGAILWGSKKQELVTLSTAESEYIAATHAAKEAIWLQRLIGEMFLLRFIFFFTFCISIRLTLLANAFLLSQ